MVNFRKRFIHAYKPGITQRGVTWGWVTDRFPKIQSGSLIEMAKNGVFGVFRVFLAKNFLAAPKMSKIGQFCTKSGRKFWHNFQITLSTWKISEFSTFLLEKVIADRSSLIFGENVFRNVLANKIFCSKKFFPISALHFLASKSHFQKTAMSQRKIFQWKKIFKLQNSIGLPLC